MAMRNPTVKDREEKIAYLRKRLSEHTLLEGLAEECAELAQAALKLARAKGMNENWTPKSVDEATANLLEEAQDIALYLELLGVDDLPECTKIDRWVGRLKAAEKNN